MMIQSLFHSSGLCRRVSRWLVLTATVLLAACGQAADHSRGVFVLVDISRHYAQELDKAERLSNYLLARLNTGDSLAVAFIDNSSFTERNIIARQTFDHRPSVASRQKRAFQAQVRQFLEDFDRPSYHSDITGGVLLATDYLQSVQARHKQLYLLSDLHEDLPPQVKRDIELNLRDVEVIAVNVKRQRSDNNDPKSYRARLAAWQQQVEKNGGRWQLVNDMARLKRTVAHW